jgi:predicted nucleic acid-binding protein
LIVVDTSVWIDFFADRRDAPHVVEFLRLLDADAGLALTDIILGEILQGLSTDVEARRVRRRLEPFDVLSLRSLDDFRAGASLYRRARQAGRTIRRTTDCLIAGVCIREGCALLHNDRDFDRLARTSDLMVHPVPAG